jgi:hypothetical protein
VRWPAKAVDEFDDTGDVSLRNCGSGHTPVAKTARYAPLAADPEKAAAFGGISIRSVYRSCAVNQYGNQRGLGCASNEANYAHHIWDRRDSDGFMGATACVIVRWFADGYTDGAD